MSLRKPIRRFDASRKQGVSYTSVFDSTLSCAASIVRLFDKVGLGFLGIQQSIYQKPGDYIERLGGYYGLCQTGRGKPWAHEMIFGLALAYVAT